MIQTDLEYLNLISHRLERFKPQGDNIFNFRCFVCGDSKKNRSKARGYLFPHKLNLFYKCHNCGYSSPFAEILKTLDSELFKRYALEKFYNKQSRPKKEIVYNYDPPQFSVIKSKFCTKIKDLDLNHEARIYLENRKIPIDLLYYTEDFGKFTKDIKNKSIHDSIPRIIIPFLSRDKKLIGYQGRAIANVDPKYRYLTEKMHPNATKIFGLERVDVKKTIYVTEGPFDSLFLANAIALAGSDSSEWLNKFPKDKLVIVLDNEKRNNTIINKYEKFIKQNYKIFIWPEYIIEKDLNDLALNPSYNHTKFSELINSNTFLGVLATVKLSQWKKC